MGSSDCVHPGPRNSTRWLPVDSCYTTCSFVFSWKRLYNEMCKVFKQGANARWLIQWKYYNLTDLKTEQTLFHTLEHSNGLSQMNELKKWWTKQRCLPFSSWSAYEILVRTYRRMDPWQLHIALMDVLTISASANISLICLSKIAIQNRGTEMGLFSAGSSGVSSLCYMLNVHIYCHCLDFSPKPWIACYGLSNHQKMHVFGIFPGAVTK